MREIRFDAQNQSGQSIIEVLIATLLVAFVLTAIASSLTLSIQSTSQTRQRELATNFAQEGIEFFRKQRSILGWSVFSESLDNEVFCLNDIPQEPTALINLPIGSCDSGSTIAGHSFYREASISLPDPDSIQVDITVRWIDGASEKEVFASQIFRNIR